MKKQLGKKSSTDGSSEKSAIFLGKTTMRFMLNAARNEKDPLYKRNTYHETFVAMSRFEDNPKVGDEIIYVYYHPKENKTIMTNIKDDTWGVAGSSAGFEGKVVL